MPLEDARKALAIGLLKPETAKLLAEDNKLTTLHNKQESWVLGFAKLPVKHAPLVLTWTLARLVQRSSKKCVTVLTLNREERNKRVVLHLLKPTRNHVPVFEMERGELLRSAAFI